MKTHLLFSDGYLKHMHASKSTIYFPKLVVKLITEILLMLFFLFITLCNGLNILVSVKHTN